MHHRMFRSVSRAFSQQLRLSPFGFDAFVAAVAMRRANPLIDETCLFFKRRDMAATTIVSGGSHCMVARRLSQMSEGGLDLGADVKMNQSSHGSTWQ